MAKIRRHDLILVAVELAKMYGYSRITRDEIAKKAGVAMGTVTNKLGTMTQVRRAIVRYAIRTEVLSIIAQAVVAADPLVLKIKPGLKKQALASL